MVILPDRINEVTVSIKPDRRVRPLKVIAAHIKLLELYCGEVELSALRNEDERHRMASVYAQLNSLRHSIMYPKEKDVPVSYEAALSGSRLARPVNKGIPDTSTPLDPINPQLKEGTA